MATICRWEIFAGIKAFYSQVWTRLYVSRLFNFSTDEIDVTLPDLPAKCWSHGPANVRIKRPHSGRTLMLKRTALVDNSSASKQPQCRAT